MLGIGNLFRALARLAGAADALADTIEATNEGLRARLGLDAPDGAEALPGPVVDEEPANGRRRAKAK